ncbi:lipase 1-like [Euwallacea similis]|uniref:lipase 1-like n=1 Tax=Euwallacea similis TaxID=1736056 RepID=UPI00344DD232
MVTVTLAKHPDENLSITQLIRRRGYAAETHIVTTTDGYMLKTFRIPQGRNATSPKKVALLAHGLASSADDWVTLGQDALPYSLADNGFDVWLFNARGTRHGRSHQTMDPDQDASKFWNFSWDEIGVYDVPANIEYILEKTGAAKLYYVGHSQGCTALFVMMSQRPDMREKVLVASLLAPAAYFEDVKDTMLLKMASLLYSPYARNVIFYEFPPKTIFYTNDLAKELCSFPGLSLFCYNAIYFGVQLKDHPIDQSLVPIIAQHAPSTFSTKQIHHYTQIMETGEFKRFDYGSKGNSKRYGTRKAPKYNLSVITMPTVIFYGTGDYLASPKSVKRVAAEITNSEKTVIEVPYAGFDHIDFLWARNVKQLVYDKTLEVFKRNFGKP